MDDYKVISYIIRGRVRYKLVDSEGRVINDANGYGFKSERSARKSQYYLEKWSKEERNTLDYLKPIYEFLASNKELIEALDELSYYSGSKELLNSKSVERLMNDLGFEGGYSASDILYCYLNSYESALRKNRE